MDRFRGFSGERGPEEGPERRAEGLSLEINHLLAKLIEGGPEFDPFYKKQLRAYLHELLGIFDIEERNAEGLLEVRRKMDTRPSNLPVNAFYPSLQEFQQGLLNVIFSEENTYLPELPTEITAIEVSKFAQYDWLSLDGGDSSYTMDHLYELGKIMVSKPAYEALFPDFDNIAIDENWQVENGPQRALVLKTLGPLFVNEKGMASWIDIDNLTVIA